MQSIKLFFFLIGLVFITDLSAQDSSKHIITKKIVSGSRIILDFKGAVLPDTVWKRLVISGEYGLKPFSGDTLTLYKLSEKEKEKRVANLENMPKPRESKAFYVGENFYKLKTKDIYGNKINSKELKGKIIVLNYWFTNCPPCRMEIPELNKIAADYKTDSSIVFIAIALDDADEIAEFIRNNPFTYSLIADGKYLDNSYKITEYPTNVVLDRDGKVYFHAVGYGPNTVFWIRKSIENIRTKFL